MCFLGPVMPVVSKLVLAASLPGAWRYRVSARDKEAGDKETDKNRNTGEREGGNVCDELNKCVGGGSACL